MILAGDIGGTTTRLGLFDARDGRPRLVTAQSYPTRGFAGLTDMLSAFASEPDVRGAHAEAACFGIAGPVLGDLARLTNVPFEVNALEVAQAFDIPRVALLNDLQAMAYAVPALDAGELLTLQAGEECPNGNVALIAAGTGLGQALLHNVGGRLIPSPSEAGHADYAPRTEREVAVLRELTQRYGRAEVEQVVSGPGLVNLHRVTHTGPCLVVEDETQPDAPARIASAAIERRCRGCMDALALFVDAYGAEAGNLALRSLATGGVYVGGGIAPKILPALTDGRFLNAFLDKGTMQGLLARVPLRIILSAEPGLLGAAVFAAGV